MEGFFFIVNFFDSSVRNLLDNDLMITTGNLPIVRRRLVQNFFRNKKWILIIFQINKIGTMKNLISILLITFIGLNVFSQKKAVTEAFDVEVIGEGKPLILIPGLSCSGEVWNESVEDLQREYECHILTLAGFADQAPFDYKDAYLPKIEKEVVNYIKTKLEEKPILMGHSLGGFLSLSIAQNNDGLVEKIIIVDSFPFYSAAMMPSANEESAKPQAEMMKNMMLNTPEDAFEGQQKMTLAAMITDEDKIETALAWSLQADRKTVAQAMYEIMSTDLRKKMALAKCPILVMGSWAAGKDYGITKEMTADIYKTQFKEAANCEILMAETAKHFIMWDEPVWFLENVKQFLN